MASWKVACTFDGHPSILSSNGPIESRTDAAVQAAKANPKARDIEVFGPVDNGKFRGEPADKIDDWLALAPDRHRDGRLLRMLEDQIYNGRRLFGRPVDGALAEYLDWVTLVYEVTTRLQGGIDAATAWDSFAKPDFIGKLDLHNTVSLAAFYRLVQRAIGYIGEVLKNRGVSSQLVLSVLESGNEADDKEEPAARSGTTSRPMPRMPNARKVFVVHGRNSDIRDAMFVLLRALDLEPLEWSKIVTATGEASPYIGKVLETGFSMVQAVVVLMTPDDEARLREPYHKSDDPSDETNLSPQPRPNVLIEAGMALGLHRTKTIIVQFGQLRQASDLLGRHVLRWTNTAECRNDLAQRLKTAGCAVNTGGADWLTAGDFAAALPPTPVHQAKGEHPAFAKIREQLSDDEAAFLQALNGHGPIDVTLPRPVTDPSAQAILVALPKYARHSPHDLDAYLDHLKALGLIEHDEVWDEKIGYVQGCCEVTVEVSAFGEQFICACFPDGPATP